MWFMLGAICGLLSRVQSGGRGIFRLPQGPYG
jgi:hypothetical protein